MRVTSPAVTIKDIWDALTAEYGIAGSYGLLVETNLDEKVSVVDAVADAIKVKTDAYLDAKVSEAKADVSALALEATLDAVAALATLIEADTAGIGGDAMRGTDGAALASAWTAALAALLPKTLTYKSPSAVDQTNPVTNQWYTVLDTTTNIFLDYVIFMHDYTVNRKIDVKITIDGVTLEETAFDAARVTDYFITTFPTAGGTRGLEAVEPTTLTNRVYPLEGHSVKVEIRTTETIDGGDWLKCAAYYHRRE